jgi:fructose-1,6-bisphosphatase II / sedoheptulose-1,7-bisphosphatase
MPRKAIVASLAVVSVAVAIAGLAILGSGQQNLSPAQAFQSVMATLKGERKGAVPIADASQMVQAATPPAPRDAVGVLSPDLTQNGLGTQIESVTQSKSVISSRDYATLLKSLSSTDGTGLAKLKRIFTIEIVRVTEAAAIAAARLRGRGDEKAADQAAVDAMRQALNQIADLDGLVVIGEGERDEAPMLYIGEKVGLYARAGGGQEVDIAVDPLEGTSITAKGGPNAMATVALAQKGGFLHAPDIYMDKLAVGPGLPPGVVNLQAGVEENLRELAKAKKCSISDLVVCLLDRDRHKEIVKRCRAAGARIMMIPDGDVSGVVAVSQVDTGVDIYMGSGGAPEGVLAAAALRCIGGQMQGRLMFENDEQIARAREMGVTDPNRIYELEDMAKGDVMFAATGVTTGPMLRGVRHFGSGAVTHSIVMRSKSGTVRYVEGHHNFALKPAAFIA